MGALSSLIIPARPNDNNDVRGGGCRGSSGDGGGCLGSRAELMVPWTTQLLPRGHLNLLGWCACLHSSGSALGCEHGKRTRQPQTPWFNEGPWACHRDAVGGLPGSSFPSCQPAGWECWGSQGDSCTSLSECPQVKRSA